MRRLFADRLVFATAVIVILMSVLFALLRVAGYAAPIVFAMAVVVILVSIPFALLRALGRRG